MSSWPLGCDFVISLIKQSGRKNLQKGLCFQSEVTKLLDEINAE